METKEKLITLFEKTCSNYNVQRSLDCLDIKINTDILLDIKNIFVERFGSFVRYDRHKNNGGKDPFYGQNLEMWYNQHGFNFNDLPPILITGVGCKYFATYKKSYFGLGTDKKRIVKEVQELLDSKNINDYSFSDFGGLIRINVSKGIIIYGTIFSEITLDEYKKLKTDYISSVKKYDEFKLNERLK